MFIHMLFTSCIHARPRVFSSRTSFTDQFIGWSNGGCTLAEDRLGLRRRVNLGSLSDSPAGVARFVSGVTSEGAVLVSVL